MEHQTPWEKLRAEMSALKAQGVRSIDPQIVLSYMRFLEKIEEAELEQSNKG